MYVTAGGFKHARVHQDILQFAYVRVCQLCKQRVKS